MPPNFHGQNPEVPGSVSLGLECMADSQIRALQVKVELLRTPGILAVLAVTEYSVTVLVHVLVKVTGFSREERETHKSGENLTNLPIR